MSTGDDAVEWALFYYTKDIRNLYKTRQTLRESVLKLSRKQGISLATPRLLQVNPAEINLGEINHGEVSHAEINRGEVDQGSNLNQADPRS